MDNQHQPPMVNQLNRKKTALLVLLVLVAMAITGTVVYFLTKPKPVEKTQVVDNQKTEVTEGETEDTQPDETSPVHKGSELAIKNWGISFYIPTGLADVQYRIHGDTVYFYGKPSSPKVEYRTGYDSDNVGQYALGKVKRSKEPTQDVIHGKVDGKKIGDYYYYTGHSFSGLESDAGLFGLFYTPDCIEKSKTNTDTDDSECNNLSKAEGETFVLINGDDEITGLLNTISLTE